nr:unnamed protein product [Haemonchus contortus]
MCLWNLLMQKSLLHQVQTQVWRLQHWKVPVFLKKISKTTIKMSLKLLLNETLWQSQIEYEKELIPNAAFVLVTVNQERNHRSLSFITCEAVVHLVEERLLIVRNNHRKDAGKDCSAPCCCNACSELTGCLNAPSHRHW